MKITYVPMPVGDPVLSIDGATRRAVKTTLKNLKKWCAWLRRFNSNRPTSRRIQDYDHERWIATTMIVDPEESRNRANENLENELRESLMTTNSDQTMATTATFVNVNTVINDGLTRCS